MKNRIITISREFGSGGCTIGKNVASRLDIPCYDQELVYRIAQESGFSADYVKNAIEDAKVTALGFAISTRKYCKTNEDYLWEIQTKVVSELAESGSCVIIGYCADYILR